MIGGCLTEVNVTSPTGVQEVNALDNTCIEAKVMAAVEAFVAEEARGVEGRTAVRCRALRMAAWPSLDPWLSRSRSWTGRDRVLHT